MWMVPDTPIKHKNKGNKGNGQAAPAGLDGSHKKAFHMEGGACGAQALLMPIIDLVESGPSGWGEQHFCITVESIPLVLHAALEAVFFH